MSYVIDGVEFSDDYEANDEIVWVTTEWLMRNATHSCDFSNNFTLGRMIQIKARDTGFGNLVDSILERGFMEQGAIGFDRGYITEGHHRFTAAILLCLPMVPIKKCGGYVSKEGCRAWYWLVDSHSAPAGTENPIEVEF